ncbi:hypothetical protein GB937_004086 [Aspergillus fischeri]|nr:hypothetical protein GB937_004086 [Aspergillus fischeri]
MAYQPSRQNKQVQLSLNLPDERTDFYERAPKLHVRRSAWNRDHMRALRVVPLDDCPISKICEAQYLPQMNDPGLCSV